MSEKSVTGRDFGDRGAGGNASPSDAVSQWFVCEILPFEAKLMQYLRNNWRNATDHADLRQDIYAKVLAGARNRLPENAERFLFACARNYLIDRVRHSHVIPIETVADLEALDVPSELPGPDLSIMALDDIRRIQSALELLPARARDAIRLAYFEGLTGNEIAARMGVTKSAASHHLANAIRILSNLFGKDRGDA